MNQTFQYKDLIIKINTSAYVIPIYQSATGNDIFSDLAKMGMNNEKQVLENFSLRTLLDILFAFAYNADNNLVYEDFYAKIPMKYTLQKDFIEQLAGLITKELMPEVKDDGVSNQKK